MTDVNFVQEYTIHYTVYLFHTKKDFKQMTKFLVMNPLAFVIYFFVLFSIFKISQKPTNQNVLLPHTEQKDFTYRSHRRTDFGNIVTCSNVRSVSFQSEGRGSKIIRL